MKLSFLALISYICLFLDHSDALTGTDHRFLAYLEDPRADGAIFHGKPKSKKTKREYRAMSHSKRQSRKKSGRITKKNQEIEKMKEMDLKAKKKKKEMTVQARRDKRYPAFSYRDSSEESETFASHIVLSKTLDSVNFEKVESDELCEKYYFLSQGYLHLFRTSEQKPLSDFYYSVHEIFSNRLDEIFGNDFEIEELRRRVRIDRVLLKEIGSYKELILYERESRTNSEILGSSNWRGNVALREWDSSMALEDVVRDFLVPWMMKHIKSIRIIYSSSNLLASYDDYEKAFEDGRVYEILSEFEYVYGYINEYFGEDSHHSDTHLEEETLCDTNEQRDANQHEQEDQEQDEDDSEHEEEEQDKRDQSDEDEEQDEDDSEHEEEEQDKRDQSDEDDPISLLKFIYGRGEKTK